MQETWHISGAFAEWRLTLIVDPPEDALGTPLTEWPAERAESIAPYFRELVNCHEYALELERYQRSSGYIGIS